MTAKAKRPPVMSPHQKKAATKRVRLRPRPEHQLLAEKVALERGRLAATHRAFPKALRPSAGHSVALAPLRLCLPKAIWRSAASFLASTAPRASTSAFDNSARAARKLQTLAERETRELLARNDADDRGFKNALRSYNNELTRQQRIGEETRARRAAIAADDEAHKAKAGPARPAAAGPYAVLGFEL